MAKREFDLKIDDEDRLGELIQALDATVRRRIMCMLRSSCYSIAELAKRLKLPIFDGFFSYQYLAKSRINQCYDKTQYPGECQTDFPSDRPLFPRFYYGYTFQ